MRPIGLTDFKLCRFCSLSVRIVKTIEMIEIKRAQTATTTSGLSNIFWNMSIAMLPNKYI
jgi:hypothetical protein